MVDIEVLDALADELEELRPELEGEREIIFNPTSRASSVAESVANYLELVGRIGQAAEIVEMPGLQMVARFIAANAGTIEALSHAARVAAAPLQHCLGGWIEPLDALLRQPHNADSLDVLLSHLTQDDWPQAIEPGLVEALRNEFEASQLATTAITESGRETQAHPEAVAIGFADDISPQLVDAFLQETPVYVGRFSEAVQELNDGAVGRQQLANAQRLAHTIKGSANITGIRGMANLTHHAEDILEYLAEQNVAPNGPLADLLVRTADCLEAMLEHLIGTGPAPDDDLDVLQELLDWANRVDSGGVDLGTGFVESGPLDAAVNSPLAPRPEVVPPSAERFSPPTQAHGIEVAGASEQTSVLAAAEPVATDAEPQASVEPVAQPAAETEAVASAQATGAALRVSMARIDSLLRLAGEMTTAIVRLAGYQRSLINRAGQLTEQNLLVQQRLSALQDLVELRGVPSVRRELGGLGIVAHARDKFDPLELDEYNELHSATNALAETLTDVREMSDGLRAELTEFDDMVVQQQQVSTELNSEVLSARMVPVYTVTARLQRAIRQASRATGKKATLDINGQEMLVDSVILNNIVDPLLHLLRNAIDHGIESADWRQRYGKPTEGRIRVDFRQEGETVVVSCEDDGFGLDLSKIRATAVEKGLIEADANLDEQQLSRLTLLPGFTTRTDATQISGRGIGLDVVHKSIVDLRGTIALDTSELGGLRVQVRVPLTLISMHVLLVRTAERVFGVPSSSVDQILFSDAGTVSSNEASQLFGYLGDDYPVASLAELLGFGRASKGLLNGEPRPLLLVEADNGRAAVAIDAVVDGRYLVVKQLGTYVPKVKGIVGASILADGSVAPVLDVRDLMRSPASVQVDTDQIQALSEAAMRGIPNVLIVDDSLSARRTLTQVVSEAGFEPRTAVDGLEAIEFIEQRMPDAVLLDMEMPRMNGLELAAHLRAGDETRNLPLVMVTSRSTLKHRDQAKAAGVDVFVTKPYEDAELTQELHRLLAVS